jgi:O-antigen/teichoic acid export membrane protein
MCCLLYILIWIAAPWIAIFYDDQSLISVIRVLSLTIVISGVKNIQQAYVSRNLIFKKFFFATLGGTIGAAVLGITLAYFGFGVWALVAQHLFNTTVDTLILWITVKWRPKKMFSWNRLKGLFSYGWKLLASTLLDTVYSKLRQLIIGKLYTKADLAQYNWGEQFPYLITANINTSIDSVLLPTMSAEQDNKASMKELTRRSIKTSTYIMAPMMMGLCFVATPAVRLLITDKWLPCVPYLRIFCITYMFYPIHTANLNAIKAMGRSDIFLKLEIIKKIVGLVILLSTIWISVKAMAYSLLLTTLFNQIVNSWPNKKLLNYGYLEQLKDILPGILLAVFMGACVSLVSLLRLSDLVTLVIQIPLGAAIYFALSALFKIDTFQYLLDIVKPAVRKLIPGK